MITDLANPTSVASLERAAGLPPRRSLVWPAVVAAAALTACSSLLSGRLFADRWAMLLALLSAAPALVASTTLPGEVRAILHAMATVCGLAIATLAAGGTLADAAGGALGGFPGLLTVSWPTPVEPRLVAAVGAMVAAVSIVAAEMARRRRWRVALLIPGAVLAVVITALAAPGGRPGAGWWVLWGVTAVAVLALAPQVTTHRGAIPAGVMPVVATLSAAVVAVAVGGAALVDGSVADRFDPRHEQLVEPVQLAGFESLAGIAARRQDTTPTLDLRVVPAEVGQRWRLFAFDGYDGIDWTVASGFRRAGRRLDGHPPSAATKDVTIEVLLPSLAWLPVSGRAISTDAAVAGDAGNSVFMLTPALPSGTTFTVQLEPTSVAPGAVASIEVSDDVVTSFRPIADRLIAAEGGTAGAGAGETTGTPEGGRTGLAGDLDRLAAALRANYSVNPSSPVSVNAGALRAVLESSAQGAEEQFVAAFVLLARSLGADARIGVGYVSRAADGALSSSDVRAWPEVRFSGSGWVTFDPVPRRVATRSPQPTRPVGAALPEAADEPSTVNPDVKSDPGPPGPIGVDGRSTGTRWSWWLALAVLVVSAGVGVAALPLGAVLAKRRRRRRRLGAPEPADRVIGAWAEATDVFVDYGAAFSRGRTNEGIAVDARPFVGEDGGATGALAVLANSAAHSTTPPDDLTVALAARLLAQVDEAVTARHDRRRRVRARCSLRSFRRSSRSPVV